MEEGRCGAILRPGRSTLHPLAAPLVLLAIAIPLIVYRLGSYSLVNGDETLRLGVAEQMVESGDWLRLEFKSEHRVYDTFMNAPLQYWARAAGIALFGSNLWTARIHSALLGVATVLATWYAALSVADRRSAFLSGFVLLTTLQFIWLHSARTGEFETAICLLLLLAAHLFQRSVERRRGFLAHHVCLALLLDLKLPLVLVPLLAEAAYFAMTPSARSQLGRWLGTGLLVAPLALAWHIFQALALPDEAASVFATMFGLAGGLRTEASGGPLENAGYYASVLLFGGHPWSFLYLPAVVFVLARAREAPERMRWRALGSSLLALLAFFVFIRNRVPWYVIPAYPFLAIFVGRWLGDLLVRGPGRLELAAIGVVAACLVFSDARTTSFHPFVREAHLIPMQVRWRSVLGVPPLPGLPLLAATLTAGLLVLRRARGERFARAAAAAFTLGFLAVGLVRVAAPLRHLGHQTEAAHLHRELAERRAAGRAIRTPIDLPDAPYWVLRYYFADDFDVVVRPRPRSEPFNSRGGIFELVPRRERPASAAPP
jgi:4-amino-4-deoxy-L-arabinose transferase-like glycosyltransferase